MDLLFFLYDKMEAWVLRMPKSIDQIKVWSDNIAQFSLFFNGTLPFSAHVAMMISTDLSFRKCYLTAKEINSLLNLIQVHIKTTLSVYNCCKKALTFISRK